MPPEPVSFLLEHYIPAQGIVLLHGKYGTYKTPLTVNMAKSIALGLPLWGLETVAAPPVLYIEMDSPRQVVLPRLQSIGLDIPPEAGDFAFCYPGFDVVQPYLNPLNTRIFIELAQAHRKRGYRAVFIDALRGLHTLSADSSETPHQVYRAVAQLFPGAVIILIHHDRKTKFEPGVDARQKQEMDHESFSGSQAWANHATVALKIEHRSKKGRELALIHHKSQAGPLQAPLVLRADETASLFTDAHEATSHQIQRILDALPADCPARLQDEAIAEALGCSTRTARSRRLQIGLGKVSGNEIAQNSVLAT